MKKVIIIGGSSGIGKGLALLYAAKGWMAGVTARRSDLLTALQNRYPANIITSCFDVTAPNNIAMINRLIDSLGGVDLFIFCAGTAELSLQPDWAIDEKIIATNVTACTKCCDYIFNYFIRKGSGQMAIISSIAALRGGSSSPVYNASKAFVSNYAEGLNLQAVALGKNIIVCDVKPGFVNTSMAKGGGKFWVMSVPKVCSQIYNAINARRRKVVVTYRWNIVALILRFLPNFLLIFITKKIAAKRQQ